MYLRGQIWWTKIKHDGKKVEKSLGTSNRKLAQAIEAKIRIEIIEGRYFKKPKGNKFTVASLIAKYLDEHSRSNKAEITYKNDKYFSKRILQHFGDKYLSDVRPRDISKFITDRRNDGVSDVTINHELRLLRHAYNLAIRNWELVDETPFAKIKIPSGDVRRVRYLFPDEEKNLMNALPKWLKPIVVIARETGLRLSNIVYLKWSEVNIFSKMIILERTKNGEPHSVPMTENVCNILRMLFVDKKNGYVFGYGEGGKPYRHWWISKSFRDTCRKAGIENFRFHDLRHDFCSRLVQRGADLYSVAGLAGHKDIKTTQRYAHLSPEKLRSTIQMLNVGDNLATMGENVDQQDVVSR
jgi:integrase|tara:strand:+ start:155 stop:1216 length:1062 start_codon:yes stop_codon:yes gene_type:complete